MIDALDDLLDIAEAAGALASGRKEEDVLHHLNGNGRAVAVAMQQLEDYTQWDPARPWTDEEDAFLESALGQLSIDEIASYLGRSPNAVKVRWTRKGFAAPSKQPGEMTACTAAKALGVDAKVVCRWIDEGILSGREAPTDRLIRLVKEVTLYRWAVNPMNWPYFENSVYNKTRSSNGQDFAKGTARMGDRRLARLIERQKERWNDRWWSTAEVAEYHGVTHELVNLWVNRGEFETAVKWQNWRVLRSEALAKQFATGRGSNSPIEWSAAADAFMVLAAAVGVGHSIIAILMGGAWDDKRVAYRLRYLLTGGEAVDICEAMNIPFDEGYVYCDSERGLLWTDWRYHARSFHTLGRAAERFRNGEDLGHIDRQYVRGVMLTWLRWFAGDDDEQRHLIHKMTYGWNVLTPTLREWHERLVSWGIEPFGEV